jgi:hypothetical protein
MRIKFLRNTVANKQNVRPGEIMDVSTADAQYLIAAKAAEMFVESEPTAPAEPLTEPVTDTVTEIEVENGEAVKQTKKKRKQKD